VSKDESLVAVGDKTGNPKIYRYPALSRKQAAIDLPVHASHVSSVAFSKGGEDEDEEYLLTGGELDNTVVFWNRDTS
jgi:WD40 repeat protein